MRFFRRYSGLALLALLYFGFQILLRPAVEAGSVSSQHLPLLRHVSPRTPNQFGVHLNAFTQSSGLEEVTQTPTYWVRGRGVRWSDVEPKPGDRNWDALAAIETEWLAARSRGLIPTVVVASTPTWAQLVPGVSCGPVDPAHYIQFGQFLYDLVSRYSGPPYFLKNWEIWNEPDIALGAVSPDSPWGCWGDPADPLYGGGPYGEMLKLLYPMIKAADPEAQVLIGGLLLDCDPRNPPPGMNCASAKFLEGILAAGGGGFFDGVSFHAYDFYGSALGRFGNANWTSAWDTTGPVVITKAAYIREVLQDYGVEGKYLVNSEGALLCGGAADPPGMGVCNGEPSSQFELTKAYYLVQAYASALAEGLESNTWYSLLGWRNSGLLNQDFSPRPAFNTYTFALQQLQNTSFVQEIHAYPGVRVLAFSRGAGAVWVIWSKDGSAHVITLPGQPSAIFDSAGNPLGGGATVVSNLEPYYIEW